METETPAKNKRKKPASKSPTQRALAILKKEGHVACVAERYNAFAGPPGMRCHACGKNRVGSRSDLFGFIDIVYLTKTSTVGLQVTDSTSHSGHKKKILAEPRALDWLRAGNLIELWSFGLKGGRGEVKRWVLRKEEIVEADFA